jgi:uncharacterized protein YjbI with pentapeptide repeats
MGMDADKRDFRGKDLRGRSFKGENLVGADFSDAQLGGVNFSGADLTGAKFCRAVMGQSFVGKLMGLVVQVLVGMGVMFVLLIGNIFLVGLLQAALKTMGLAVDWHNFEIVVGYAFTSIFLIWFAIRRHRLGYIFWFYFALIVLPTAVVVWKVEGDVLVKFGTIPFVIASAGAGPTVAAPAYAGMLAAATASGIFFSLLLFLNHRAVNREETQLALLRYLQLFTVKWRATRFPNQIRDADFTGANLRYARFVNVSLLNCIWKDARNLHLASTRGSLLATPQVRQLVTGHKNDSAQPCTDFSGLNLSGINVSGMALLGYNFSHANLANANFSACDLSNAQFTVANVTGANFCGATLTDAIIDNWNIDPHTRFDENTQCEFVWLGHKKDSNERERNPPIGNFKPGEFAKLYQQITDTIDFILHSRDELDAIMRSVAHLKAHGAEIEVESVERKNETVILRLKAPPTISREQIYTEVQQQFTLQLALSEKEVHMLTRERDNLSTLLIGMANRPINYFHQQGDHNHQGAGMTQNNVTQTGNTFNQSPVGIGQTVSITQSIASLPEAQAELKNLLTRLTTLIEQSQLPETDKKDALQQTGIIIEAAQEANAPQVGRVQRALGYIQEIFSGFKEAGSIMQQLQELGTQIGSWFAK